MINKTDNNNHRLIKITDRKLEVVIYVFFVQCCCDRKHRNLKKTTTNVHVCYFY